jgi:beta-lactamase class A
MLPPEERKKVLKEMLSNLKNLDRLNAYHFNWSKCLIIIYYSDAQKELLKQLLENPDLTPEERETLLKQLYENMDNLDPTVRKELMKKLIKNPNLLPPKEREKLMKEMIKNMGDLDETTKADLMRQILEK